VTYGMGPNGATMDGTSSGKKYFGLYQITYFPFTNQPHVPLVRHNGDYIDCYLDTGETTIGIDDPIEAAEQCVQVRPAACAHLPMRHLPVGRC
jgi:hypothetical protein